MLGAATWLVTTQLSGCASLGGGEGEGEGGEGEGEGVLTQPLLGGEGEGGEGAGGEGEGGEGGEGEGEGGEGEGEGAAGEGEGGATAAADFDADDVAYLTQLSLIRGHLAVGYALYTNGMPGLAETHMKHPREEIYASVAPSFKSRGCSGFGDNLTALTAVVSQRKHQAEVDAAYADLTAAVAACEQGAAANDPKVAAKVIENLLRTAGIEYDIGIVEGAVNNLHEYQDAWGFTQVADTWARSRAFAADPKATAVAGQLQDIIAGLAGMWPSLDPQGPVNSQGAQLFGAAAQVQVAAFNLSR